MLRRLLALAVLAALGCSGATAEAHPGDGVFTLVEDLPDSEADADVAVLADGSVIVGSVLVAAGGLRMRVPALADLAPVATDDGGLLALDGPAAVVRAWRLDGTTVLAPDPRRVERGWRPATSGLPVVAGQQGIPGSGGDGGPATVARLDPATDTPYARVLPRSDGGFLIADTENDRIRRVDAHGVITTVAREGRGGRGDAPLRFAAPLALAALPGGAFVVAETEGRRLLRVDAHGVVSTFATGVAWVRDLAALPDGTVVVVDDHGVGVVRPGSGRRRPYAPARGLTPCPRDSGGAVDSVGTDGRGGVLLVACSAVSYVPAGPTPFVLAEVRGSRLGRRRVSVVLESTAAGTATVEVLRRGRTVAQRRARVAPGRATVALATHPLAGWHRLRLTFEAADMRSVPDERDVYVTPRLTIPLARRLLGSDQGGDEGVVSFLGRRCRAFGRWRVDCEVRTFVDGFGGPNRETCTYVASLTRRRDATLARREYRCGDTQRPIFRRHPRFSGGTGVLAPGWPGFPDS